MAYQGRGPRTYTNAQGLDVCFGAPVKIQAAAHQTRPVAAQQPGASPADVNLNATELDVCRKMNIDPLAFSNHKRARSAPNADPNADGLNLTEEERMVCRKMGIDPKKFAEGKQKYPTTGALTPAEASRRKAVSTM